MLRRLAELRRSDSGRLLSHTLIYGVPPALTGLIGLATVPLYTRIFSPAQYGQIATIGVATALFASFSVLGLDAASARFYYDDDAEVRKSVLASWLSFQFIFSCALVIPLLLFSGDLASMLTGDPTLSVAVCLAACTLPLATFRIGPGNYLRFQNRAGATTLFFTFAIIASAALPAYLVLVRHLEIVGMFLGQLIAAVIVAAVGWVIVRRQVRPSLFSLSVLKRLLRYGLPLVPAAIAAWVTASSDRVILGVMSGTEQVGIYSLAASVASALVILITAFRMAWAPLVFSQLESPSFNSFVVNAARLGIWCACLAALAISIFGLEIVTLLAPDSYRAGYFAIPFLAFSSAIELAFIVYATGMSVAKTTVPIAKALAAGALVNILLNFALIPPLGFVGAALATCLSWAMVVGMAYRSSQRLHRIPYRPADFFGPFGTAGLLAGIGIWMSVAGYPWWLKALLLLAMPAQYFLNQRIDGRRGSHQAA